MLRLLCIAVIAMVTMSFTSAGQLRAQTTGVAIGTLTTYHVNANGQIDYFSVEDSNGILTAIYIKSPSQALTDAITAAHQKKVDVYWEQQPGGNKYYTGMTVY